MNVLLVSHRDENQHLILPQVLEELERLEGGHRLRLVRDSGRRLERFPLWQLYQVMHRVWALGQPTVVISMRPAPDVPQRRFAPAWATVWRQAPMDKIQEYTLLDRAGIPVPKWVPLRKDAKPDLSGFEEFVVVKPADGGKGAFVRVMRREKVSWRPLHLRWRPLNPGGSQHGPVSEALVVQQYVHTGPWPVSYRVGTVFGEPVYAVRFTADQSREPFDASLSGSRFFVGRTIVGASKGSTLDTDVPQDIIEFATLAHTAFPSVPLLGVDVIRDHFSGRLYVLEVNACGWTFHLSSVARSRIQEKGIDLSVQFGGAAAVARGIHRRLSEHSVALASASMRSVSKEEGGKRTAGNA